MARERRETIMEFLRIETNRDEYGVKECADRTMTVGELKDLLEDYDEDTPIVLSFDNGYTYGRLNQCRIDIDYA